VVTGAHRGAVTGVRIGAGWPSRSVAAALTSLSARLRGPWLDRELAAGVEPWHSPVHSARSLQITSQRARNSLADSLETLFVRAQRPARSPGWSAAVPVDRDAVLAARQALEWLAERLRDGAPIGTRGVAELRDVISDGSGPFYGALTGDTLRGVLAQVLASLDVPD
jgi:hypothetical protein